jgi:hypothetical protein
VTVYGDSLPFRSVHSDDRKAVQAGHDLKPHFSCNEDDQGDAAASTAATV